MIPTSRSLAAAFSRPASACWLLLPLLAACAAERETTIARSARLREVGALQSERQQLAADLQVLRQTAGQTEAEIAAATTQSVRAAARLRVVMAELQRELGLLQRAEADLAVARLRAAAIETELKPLRELENTLREQESLRAVAAARLATLRPEVEALAAQVTALEAELLPKLAALQQKFASQQALAAALAAAEQAVGAAMAPLLPPAAPAAAPVAPAKK